MEPVKAVVSPAGQLERTLDMDRAGFVSCAHDARTKGGDQMTRRVPLVKDVHAATRKGRVKRSFRLPLDELDAYVKGFQPRVVRTIRNKDSVAMMRLRKEARWVLTAKGRMV